MRERSERGAVAVEFALLAPVLILLLFGITEFGRAYNVQISLSNAAREGARVMAISNDPAAARSAVRGALGTLLPVLSDDKIVFTASTPAGAKTCSAGAQMSVTVAYTLSTLTGIAGPFSMQGQGAMLCGG
ncbi:TadE-like protein [Arthrobacter sp. ok909]|uniref:TadE/TadG family type IV pilus assembly protein n=1 Tax=Arthrobacter sp. ok909 TaxID=1761746 RepID=UPI000889711D|nr:TadE/TadG family type IV pilus assembly protein [Arthrobacter sp. ok909]SDP37601.1 TadE-like protein [Arthrobacter sp. ok909]